MATFCMQTLGCEVSAINTVNYSNHVAYKMVKGRKTMAEEVADVWTGLKNARLDRFDMMLSGYCPSAALVEEVGKIAHELKSRSSPFFWVLDPVMGDNGRIYVAEDTVPVYKKLLPDADLILPNQFEAELLSGEEIKNVSGVARAISKLHKEHGIPHVLITSVRLAEDSESMFCVGSTANSKKEPRAFRISIPLFPVFFSGTGDMFASLMVGRLRQAANEAKLLDKPHWKSPDEVDAVHQPLAKAAEKVLASMHAVLLDTTKHYEAAWRETLDESEQERHVRLTRAAEVRLVRNSKLLVSPPMVPGLVAQPLDSA
ncbi:Ribokinase-like protein [Piedraia hortae CBS 480.64]|uniref:pyridoxal kinase n=1 Tax=Piedraia hortae CBS 480.64 TaxID=1314780 RepID=A0A6A7C775_9PEZI|nr:Ribokinase-like protein [Piedraia hortae CBS 480.64]